MRSTRKEHATDTYFNLVRAFPLRRINTATEHVRAMQIYVRLSGSARDRGTRDYLNVLVDLIADFEKRSKLTIDTATVNVADLVRHRMQERGMSISDLASESGVAQSNLSEMLNGRRDWSKAAIRSLSKLFHIRAERFLT